VSTLSRLAAAVDVLGVLAASAPVWLGFRKSSFAFQRSSSTMQSLTLTSDRLLYAQPSCPPRKARAKPRYCRPTPTMKRQLLSRENGFVSLSDTKTVLSARPRMPIRSVRLLEPTRCLKIPSTAESRLIRTLASPTPMLPARIKTSVRIQLYLGLCKSSIPLHQPTSLDQVTDCYQYFLTVQGCQQQRPAAQRLGLRSGSRQVSFPSGSTAASRHPAQSYCHRRHFQ